MAAILPTSLGDIGRVGILKVFRQEAPKYDDLSNLILGNHFYTRQTFEILKSLIGLGQPKPYGPGELVQTDSLAPQFSQSFTPFKVATAVAYAYETAWVDRYNQIASLQKQAAEQFILKRNNVAANIDNTGFTATTYGMNSESLYSTAHSNNGYAGSNRPAIDIAMGPQGIMQMRSEMQQQLSTRGSVMPYSGDIIVTYPIALDATAFALANSDKIPGSNNNEPNYGRVNVKYHMINFYTSMQAWFGRYANNERHGKFMLDQIPYDVLMLPINQSAVYTYLMLETYIAGWYRWYGTWGTTGA